jgi:MFS family permease
MTDLPWELFGKHRQRDTHNRRKHMLVEMPKAKRILFMLTFMLVNIVIIGDVLFVPTINDVYKLFPRNAGMVNFAVSGNYLMIVCASILAGKLCRIIGQKLVIIIGSICSLAGGVLLLAIENVFFLCAMRLLFAFGFAFCQVSSMSLISDLYTDNAARGSMMGYFNSVRYMLGAGMSAFGGKLAAISAKTAYRGYWMILPVVVLEILFLPSIKPPKLEAEHKEKPKELKEKKQALGGLYWGIAICFSLCYFVFTYVSFFISVYVEENALGTPVVAGYATSLFTFGTGIISLAFGSIYKKIGKNIILLAYIGTAMVLVVLMTVPTLTVLYVTAIFRGGFVGIALTYCYFICPNIVPKERSKDAIAVLTAIYSFAIFLSPFAVSWSMKFIGNGRYTPTIIVPVIIGIAIFFAQLLLNMKQPPKNQS